MDRVLIVDDDPDILEIVKEILAKEGYAVMVAKDGQEALNLALANNPDLIVTDCIMPVMDGIQLCQALQKDNKTKSIPVIMITAYPSEKELGLRVGAVDFLTKPIEKIDLLTRIKCALKVRHIENELQKAIAYIAELEKRGS
jgi:DNA-binding response OmpR family regulator